MNIIKFYEDYNIDYKTEGHKHCRDGWVNTSCPFCTGNPGYHLGFPMDGHVFKCYRCGKHSLLEGVSKLLSTSFSEAKRIAQEYKGVTTIKQVNTPIIKPKGFKYPSNTSPITSTHKRYLEGRGFDPKNLVRNWEILGTGPLSFLSDGIKQIDYKHRIVAPIYWNGQLVSFQSRSIKKKTEHGDVKYLACPKIRERIHHKHLVYANPANWEKMKNGIGIGVEGITDVWKLGENAVCTFGIEYKVQQINIIARHFKRFAVVFDDESQAKRQAKKLVEELCLFGVDAFYIPIVGDPGAMSYEEAHKLTKSIITKIY